MGIYPDTNGQRHLVETLPGREGTKVQITIPLKPLNDDHAMNVLDAAMTGWGEGIDERWGDVRTTLRGEEADIPMRGIKFNTPEYIKALIYDGDSLEFLSLLYKSLEDFTDIVEIAHGGDSAIYWGIRESGYKGKYLGMDLGQQR